jgi:hypothetical protein
MQQKQLNNLTNEEILLKWKTIQAPTKITFATLILAIILTIIRVINEGLSISILYVPVFIAIITITVFLNYKSLQKEIKTRKLE